MADAKDREEGVPTHYANIATSLLTADELVMELRRVDKPHRDVVKETSGLATIVPPATPAEILSHEPIARVVLTFTAAKALKEYLDSTLPRIEEMRKTGKLQ
jgi:hypothetical protein